MTIDYSTAREMMVEQQIRPWDVLNARVLETLAQMPREAFVPETLRKLAYVDTEIPLGHGASMMKPVVEGRMLQALDIQPNETVLEIGSGSGFISACLGALGHEVVSLEIVPELADAARARLETLGLDVNIRIETADVFQYSSTRQFDAICITGAVPEVPQHFLQWLRPGGRLFAVRGQAPAMEAVLLRKRDGNDVNAVDTESLFETELAYLHGITLNSQFRL
ncbi:MAG: protein-L-isoaspartate O-methyltransferase [Xanthomonadaceae bacterium]|jgi:protein-L-isoaspartate(D-aspartate) O-methyltransferase|nr:protein-L-isoaspartate O-methyltransferase [Xanthomonadaceae bacterium]